MTLLRISSPGMTDEAFCLKVCRIAQENGWTLDDMCTELGQSYAFEHRDGRRIAGDIAASATEALVDACKKLLPEIYSHL